MRVLVLRPEPQAGRMAAALAARGLDATVAPMLEVSHEADVAARVADPAMPDALAFTSAHGVAALAADPRSAPLLALPAYAVGPATAATARAAGFTRVTDCAGDGADLVARILAELPPEAVVVHVAGRDRASDVAALLGEAGRRARRVVAYRAEAVEDLPPSVAADLAAGGFDIAVVGSRRTAETFRRALASLGMPLPLDRPVGLAISAEAAGPLRGALARVETAAAPSGEALTEGVVALAARLANNE